MTNQNKFAAALKTTPKSASLPTPATAGRRARRHIGGYFNDEVAQQLRFLAVEERTTVQALLEEALDGLFASHGKATRIRGA
jgi:hypothetical protein